VVFFGPWLKTERTYRTGWPQPSKKSENLENLEICTFTLEEPRKPRKKKVTLEKDFQKPKPSKIDMDPRKNLKYRKQLFF
jgi:hypothetical protein